MPRAPEWDPNPRAAWLVVVAALLAAPAGLLGQEASGFEDALKEEIRYQIEDWNQELREYDAGYQLVPVALASECRRIDSKTGFEDARRPRATAGGTLILSGDLGTGETCAARLDLGEAEAGGSSEFIIFAICDDDCIDIDLGLLNGDGEVLDSDQAEDARPILEFDYDPTAQASELTAVLVMVECDAYPCHYALAACSREPVQ